MSVNEKYKECIKELVKDLEKEFMAIIADPKLDKHQKNIRTKSLVTKKQILMNALESLEMVDRVREDEEYTL
ncbi:MAG: hypothetical protein GXO61_04150 [Epsilonproteobacteria bacterium]|nr:hypothetical protein [Campylobacterota bacterium]